MCFFLYKGESLEYKGTGDEHSAKMYRRVDRHEFGETCKSSYVKDVHIFRMALPSHYTPADFEKYARETNKVWRAKLFRALDNGEWEPLPAG